MYESIWYVLKIIFQISNKLADLVPRLTGNIFEFWLGLPQGVNVAKTGVNLAVPYYQVKKKTLRTFQLVEQHQYYRNLSVVLLYEAKVV